MITVIRGTFYAKLDAMGAGTRLIDVHAVTAQTALSAKTLSVVIALFAVRAMASIANGTIRAKLDSVSDRARLIIVRTIVAQTALSTKMGNFVIALVTAGAMSLPPIYDTIKAKTLSVVATTRCVYIDTVLA